jgi:ComF family protein
MLKHFVTFFKSYLPEPCLLCDLYTESTQGKMCRVCQNSLPWLTERCYRCGLNLGHEFENIYCRKCLMYFPGFDRFCGLFSYDKPIQKMIKKLKTKGDLVIAQFFADMLLQELPRWYLAKKDFPEVIIPMPLHKKRLYERGFNQVIQFLSCIEKQLPVPICRNRVERVKNTPHQAQLNKVLRKYNIKDAFAINAPIPYQHVAVVDDVLTTGNTVKSLCECLYAAGVETIDVWCIARS